MTMLIYTTALLVTAYLFGRGDIIGYEDVPQYFNHDTGISLDRLVTKYGYPFEFHTTQTKDGYILGLHRIPHGRGVQGSEKRPPVLLHGSLLCDSASWIANGPDNALAYYLANAGYDVWLANPRGTTYSRKHIHYDPDSSTEFWDFTFDQVGEFDMPAIYDYVLSITNSSKLNYIGHSQGSVAFLIMAVVHPEYNLKTSLAVLFAPVHTLEHTRNPYFRFLAEHRNIFQFVTRMFNIHEFFPRSRFAVGFSNRVCHERSPLKRFCFKVFELFSGPNPEQFNTTLVPIVGYHIPAGTSTKTILHFFQLYNNRRFAKYDYGCDVNKKLYGSEAPMEYNLSKVIAPTVLYSGGNDWLSDVKEIAHMATLLSNLVELNNIESYNHLDFKWALNVVPVIYGHVLELYFHDISQDVTQLATRLPNVIEVNELASYNHMDFKWAPDVVSLVYTHLIQVFKNYNGGSM